MTPNQPETGSVKKRVGVYLRAPVFKHDQLYVAISRVGRSEYIEVYIPDGDSTRNVLYHELLRNCCDRRDTSPDRVDNFDADSDRPLSRNSAEH